MKFKLHQQTYIENEADGMGAALREIGYELELLPTTSKVPGPHWEPIDDEAKALCKKHGIVFTGHVPDCMDSLTKQLAEAMERERQAGNPDAIAAAMVKALMEAGVIPKPVAKPAARAMAPAEV